MSKQHQKETIYIGIYTHCQSSSKTFVAIQLADALARSGYAVHLIDEDAANADGAGTTTKLLGLKPRRNRGFTFGKYADYDKDGKCNFAIFDTSRKPSEIAESTVREDCDLVIIPALSDPENDPGEKSLADALSHVWELRDAGKHAVVLPVLRNGGVRMQVEAVLKPARAKILSFTLQDEPLASKLLNHGDLLTDCSAGEEAASEAAEQRFDTLTNEVLTLAKSSADVVLLAESA